MRTFMSSAHERRVFPAGYSAALPSSSNVTRGIGGRFYRAVRHVRTSHQRRRFHVMEPELQRFAAELRELLGRPVFADGVVVAGWGEVLPHGEDVDAGIAEVAGDGKNLVFGFAEAEHETRLRQHIGGGLPAPPAEGVERALGLRAPEDGRGETRR